MTIEDQIVRLLREVATIAGGRYKYRGNRFRRFVHASIVRDREVFSID